MPELVSISSLYEGEEKKVYSLGYGTFQNGSLKLNGVHDLSDRHLAKLVCSFVYYENVNLPNRNSRSTDHWGYFNNATYINQVHPQIKLNGLWTNGIDKTPNPIYTVANTLQQVHYGTGGFKKFQYESHSGIDPTTGTTARGGGLRIKQILERTDSLSQPSTVSYSYEGGVLYADKISYCSSAKVGQNNQVEYEISANSIDPLADLNNCTVIYSGVTEHLPNGASIKYKYVSYNDRPDESGTTFSVQECGGPLYSAINNKVPKTSFHWRRNLLIEKSEYDAQEELVQKTTYQYDFPGQKRFTIQGMKCYTSIHPKSSSYPNRISAHFSKYIIYSAPVYLVKEIVEQGRHNLASTTQYAYDFNRMLLISTQTTDCEGNQNQTLITYPTDYAATSDADECIAGLNGLKARKAENIPIEIIKTKNNMLIGSSLNLYKMVNCRPMLSEVKQVFIERPENIQNFVKSKIQNNLFVCDSRYETVSQTTDFDAENLALSSLAKGDYCQSIIYGYDNTLPIASVENARHSTQQLISGRELEPLNELTQAFTVSDRRNVGFILDFIKNRLPQEELRLDVCRQSDSIVVYSIFMNGANDYFQFHADLEPGSYKLALHWADPTVTTAIPSVSATVDREYKQYRIDITNEVFHTSFEPGDTYRPSNTNILKKFDLAKSGEWVCKGDFTIDLSGFKRGSYMLTYWTYNTTEPQAGWSQNYATVTASITQHSYILRVKANTYVDELRMMPSDAAMTTYTYNPGIGKTSETDINGRTTYYSYDAGGRLIAIADDDRSLLKRYTYEGQNKVIEETRNGRAELNKRITYLDGLGRSEQIIDCQASPTNKDVVHIVAYDEMGRSDAVSYLPYTVAGNGNKRNSPYGEQISFYFSMFGQASAIYPYHYRFYSNTPQGYVWKERRPKDHRNAEALYETTYGYRLNTTSDAVRRYVMVNDSTVRWSGYYPATTLMVKELETDVTSLTDHNIVVEYYDSYGRAVAKEVYISDTDRRITYTVYDDMGRQRYLIPPAGNTLFSSSGSSRNPYELRSYCYYSVYDKYGNATKTLIQGSDWTYSLYDNRGRLVMSQKPELRNEVDTTQNRWTFTKYDVWDHPVQTGVYTGGTYQTHHEALASQTVYGEGRTNDTYTNKTYPQLGLHADVLTTVFYDDYTWDNHSYYSYNYKKKLNRDGTVSSHDWGVGKSAAKGLVTGRRSKILDNNGGTKTTSLYYNKNGQVTQSVTDLYPEGLERVINHYDEAGNIVYVCVCQYYDTYKCGYGKSLLYDKQDRLINVSQVVFENHGEKILGPDGLPNDDPNNGTVSIATYTYNELGLLASKKIHNEAETTNYTYDISGATLSSLSPSFSYWLSYDNPTIQGVVARYNGTPGSATWQRSGGTEQGFRYTYDPMGQLSLAEFYEKTDGIWTPSVKYKEQMAYDVSGNITTINRTTRAGRPAVPMTQTYDGYRMTQSQVRDEISTFEYDKDGNMTYDGNQNVNIEYNILGLPSKIFDSSHEIRYIYNANGEKLAVVRDGSYTYYRGSLTFDHAGQLISLQHPEGFVLRTSYGNYLYKYFKTDHVGNNRALLSIQWGNQTLEQETDFYPFGLAFTYQNRHLNRQLFSGKELQDASMGSGSLDWYDFGARLYNPTYGRWFNADPALQVFNPYLFCGNAPMCYIDKDGQWFWLVVGIGAAIGGYMGGAAANDSWNPGKWDWRSRETWGGILGGAIQGGIGGASLAYGISGITGNLLLGGGSMSGFGRALRLTSFSFSSAKALTTGVSLISDFDNGMDIIRGNFLYSEKKSFGGQVWQAFKRSTWERAQQYVGYTTAHSRNMVGDVNSVTYFEGAMLVNKEGAPHHRGMTMGNVINGWDINSTDDALFMHEYGHTIQSSRFGPYYGFYQAPASLVNQLFNKEVHNSFSVERQANRFSQKYFGDKWDNNPLIGTYPLY